LGEGEARQGFPAPLLPLWEKGLGDEGKALTTRVSGLMCTPILPKERLNDSLVPLLSEATKDTHLGYCLKMLHLPPLSPQFWGETEVPSPPNLGT